MRGAATYALGAIGAAAVPALAGALRTAGRAATALGDNAAAALIGEADQVLVNGVDTAARRAPR